MQRDDMNLITNEVQPNYIAITAKWLASIILALGLIYDGFYLYHFCQDNWNEVIFVSVFIFFVLCAIVSDIAIKDGDEGKDTSEHKDRISPSSSNSRREKPKEIFSKQIAYVTDNGGTIEAYSDEGYRLWCKGALNACLIGYTSSTVSIERVNVGINIVDVYNARGSCIRSYRGR